MPNRLQWWVARHAPWLLAAIAALTLCALAQLVDFRNGALRIYIDPSFESVSVQNDEQRALAERVERRFGGADSMLVVLRVADGDIYTTDALTRLANLTERLAALEGVESVRSLASVGVPYVDAGGTLRYVRANRAALADPELPLRLRRACADNPLVLGQLVSPDSDAAAIIVEPSRASRGIAAELVDRVRSAADGEVAPGVAVYVTGAPVIRAAISKAVSTQLRRVVPLVALIATALLALAFPSLRGVVLPLATIAIALIWTLAVFSASGRSLNLVTSLVPPLLATMGLAYSAHVLSEFEAMRREDGKRDPIECVASLLKEISVPISVTGSTTIVGLIALSLNEQQSMLEFAGLSALGTAFLVVLALTFAPAALRYAAPREDASPLPASRFFDALAGSLTRFNRRRRRQILAVAGGAFLVAVLAASRIEVGDVFVGVFPPRSRVRKDYDAVNAAIGGVNGMEIFIESDAADTFTDPAIVRQLDELQNWLRLQPSVGSVTGLADHVRLLYRSLGGVGAQGIPASRDAIRQLLFVGESDLMRGVVDADRKSTLIRIRLTVDDTASISALLDRLRPLLGGLPPNLRADSIGSAAVLTESVRVATSGQLQSVALALGLIYVCLSIQFMSPRIGLLASLPTVLQTALYFGALGLFRVQMNPTTVLVECLVLGLAIDDTIHYLSRFNSATRRHGSERAAAAAALRAVLRPVTLTKAVLAIGFLSIAAGELSNQALFGGLAAATLVCAWLVDAFVTPAFVSGLRIVTLWDTLRLNLGDEVQRTMPLFGGLTNRQARVFALMANLHTVPAGTRLITEGEDSGSIYAIVDGELAVSHDGPERREIARLGRGDIVGEHGYFGQKRSADVDTVTRARLLRFDEADQERLCRAYPAIAARVFLTLNRLQAERHARR